MFSACSKTASADEPLVPSVVVQPPSTQPALLATDEDTVSPINEGDLIHACCPRPGFRDLVSDHSAPVEVDEPLAHPLLRGKLNLSQLFNFRNCHWAELYAESARRSYEEELALYDLLNKDAAVGDGMEVDVDDTTGNIFVRNVTKNLLSPNFFPTLITYGLLSYSVCLHCANLYTPLPFLFYLHDFQNMKTRHPDLFCAILSKGHL